MNKENVITIFSIFATLVAGFLSGYMQSKILTITFVLCYTLACCFLLSFLESKEKFKVVLSVIMGIMCIGTLIISIINVGSFKNYVIMLAKSFESEEENKLYDEYSAKINKLLAEINDNMVVINDGLDRLSDDIENHQFMDRIMDRKEDPKEIGIIVHQIESYHKEYSDEFLNLETNNYEIELFYKMFLGDEIYYYHDIIKALEECGINCEQLSINEYDLMCWDIEELFATYNMKEDIQNDLNKKVFYTQKIFKYNDYKISISEYNDTFDYEGWTRSFENKTAEEINEKLNEVIMRYYKKFNKNFREYID